jgi:hypothetical protein
MAQHQISQPDLHAAISVALLIAAVIVIAAILLLGSAAHAATGVPACSAHVGLTTIAIAVAATGGALIGFFTNAILVAGSDRS